MITEKKQMFNEKIAALKARTSQYAAGQFVRALANQQVTTRSLGGPIVGTVRPVA